MVNCMNQHERYLYEYSLFVKRSCQVLVKLLPQVHVVWYIKDGEKYWKKNVYVVKYVLRV